MEPCNGFLEIQDSAINKRMTTINALFCQPKSNWNVILNIVIAAEVGSALLGDINSAIGKYFLKAI
jgi:hypothetical protein